MGSPHRALPFKVRRIPRSKLSVSHIEYIEGFPRVRSGGVCAVQSCSRNSAISSRSMWRRAWGIWWFQIAKGVPPIHSEYKTGYSRLRNRVGALIAVRCCLSFWKAVTARSSFFQPLGSWPTRAAHSTESSKISLNTLWEQPWWGISLAIEQGTPRRRALACERIFTIFAYCGVWLCSFLTWRGEDEERVQTDAVRMPRLANEPSL